MACNAFFVWGACYTWVASSKKYNHNRHWSTKYYKLRVNTYIDIYAGPRKHPRMRQFLWHVSKELLSALVPFDHVQRIGIQVVGTSHFGQIASRHGDGHDYAHVWQATAFYKKHKKNRCFLINSTQWTYVCTVVHYSRDTRMFAR